MRNPPWLRLVFLFVVIQALPIASALVWPPNIQMVLPWPATPLNARFIASLYAMGGLSALLCVYAKRYAEVRIILIGIGLVTGLLQLITIPHWGELAAAHTFPNLWTIFYTIDPLLIGSIVWRLRAQDDRPPGQNPLAPLFIAYATLLGLVGGCLLVLPAVAGSLWPWKLPADLGQVYSAYFLTFAVAALLAAREPRWEGVRIYVLATTVMLLIIVGVSLLHRNRFTVGPATAVWYGVLVTCLLVFSGMLRRRPGHLASEGAPA